MSLAKYGVPEADLIEALILVRNLRAIAIEKGINPVATRAALKFAMAVDDYMSQGKVSRELDRDLDKLAKAWLQLQIRRSQRSQDFEPK